MEYRRSGINSGIYKITKARHRRHRKLVANASKYSKNGAEPVLQLRRDSKLSLHEKLASETASTGAQHSTILGIIGVANSQN